MMENIDELLREYDQKEAIDALQKAQAFDRFFESDIIGFCKVSSDGIFLRVNKKLCNILQLQEGQILGTSFRQITPPALDLIDWAQVQACISGDIDQYILPKPYNLPGGDYVLAIIHVSSSRKPSKDFDYFYSMILPVDEETYLMAEKQVLGRNITGKFIESKSTNSKATSWPSQAMKFLIEYKKEISTTIAVLVTGIYFGIEAIAEAKGKSFFDFLFG